MLDDTLNTTNIILINDNKVQISHIKKYYVEDPNNMIMFVAAFITANARILFCDMLDIFR